MSGRLLIQPLFKKAAATLATWNPSDKDTNITLSGGNLTATSGTPSLSGVRATKSASSGQKYWEMTMTAVNNGATETIGLANSTASLTNYLGNDNNSVGLVGDDRILLNNVQVGTGPTFVSADIICIAADLTTQKIWFRKGAGNWNNDILANQNPAVGSQVGGVSFAAITGPYFAMIVIAQNGDNWTANFGGSAYSQTVPTGFGNW